MLRLSFYRFRGEVFGQIQACLTMPPQTSDPQNIAPVLIPIKLHAAANESAINDPRTFIADSEFAKMAKDRSHQAAIGVSASKLRLLVKEARMPRPRRIGSRAVWDVDELRAAFKALPHEGETEGSDTWADVV